MRMAKEFIYLTFLGNVAGRMLLDKTLSSPVTGLEWPRGFQEVKVPQIS
jgi:hypothetical protein